MGRLWQIGGAVHHIPLKVGVGGKNNLVQTSASIPHASSKFWGTYLLSLCFCTHSLSGIELRYSFSDSFNPRTISSNEVGVTGMSPQALPQFELPLIRNLQHLINILIGRKTCTNKRRSLREANSECSRSSDPDPPNFANLWSSPKRKRLRLHFESRDARSNRWTCVP